MFSVIFPYDLHCSVRTDQSLAHQTLGGVALVLYPSGALSDLAFSMSHFHSSVCKCIHMSLCVRKPICLGENKDADQLRGNREADQRLCFRYTDSTFPPLLIPKFSRSWVSSVTVQAGLCWTWSETQIVGFLMHRLICSKSQ